MEEEEKNSSLYTDNCLKFSVENVIKKPGCERFEIDFGDQRRGAHRRKNSLPARLAKSNRNIFHTN